MDCTHKNKGNLTEKLGKLWKLKAQPLQEDILELQSLI